MDIHHIGYIVKSIDKSVKKFEELGYMPEGEVVYDEYRDIDILFMDNGGYRIELVAPKSDKSVVYDTLKKYGSSTYHICYYSDNLEKDVEDLCKNGYIMAGEMKEAPAINNVRVCFLYSRLVGLIELVERK